MTKIVSQAISDELNIKQESDYQTAEMFKPITKELKKEVDEISKLREETYQRAIEYRRQYQ